MGSTVTVAVDEPAAKVTLVGIENRLNSLEGNQKYQVWALIVLLAGAIVKTFFLSSNP